MYKATIITELCTMLQSSLSGVQGYSHHWAVYKATVITKRCTRLHSSRSGVQVYSHHRAVYKASHHRAVYNYPVVTERCTRLQSSHSGVQVYSHHWAVYNYTIGTERCTVITELCTSLQSSVSALQVYSHHHHLTPATQSPHGHPRTWRRRRRIEQREATLAAAKTKYCYLHADERAYSSVADSVNFYVRWRFWSCPVRHDE